MFRSLFIFALVFALNVQAESPVPPHVLAQLPAQELKPGDLVEIPINIVADDMEIVSYAVELQYDKSLVRFIDVYAGLTPMFEDQPMYNTTPGGRSGIRISGSANSFGQQQKIINVANLKFELISDNSRPRFKLIQRGPTVRRAGFVEVEAIYSVEGVMDLYNIQFDSGFE